MLKRTFIHLPKVGPRREAHFWRQGIETWEDLLAAQRIYGLSRERVKLLKKDLRESVEFVADPGYFGPRLAQNEHWRLFRNFPRVGYLDIETTGTFWPGLLVTVVGLYDGVAMRQFVQGYNLKEFPAALKDLDLLVTFNGTQFDLPVLRAYFEDLALPPLHVDLRFLLARLGYRGGLKKIEPRFGIHRPAEVNGMDGYMAVLLWQRYQRGDRTSLDLLLKYNREDVINLEVLMEQAFEMQRERLLPGNSFTTETQRAQRAQI
jgi:hypothetical protein